MKALIQIFWRSVIIIGIIFRANAQWDDSKSANAWLSSFYTDDSKYFLKLNSNGFTQRFIIKKDVCSKISNADLILKKKKTNNEYSNFAFSRISSNSAWPALYGMNLNDYCIFEATANGLDLNDPNNNEYILRIFSTNSNSPFYFRGFEDSLMTVNRFSRNLNFKNWISLGQFGATPVKGGGVFFKVWEPYSQKVILNLTSSESLTTRSRLRGEDNAKTSEMLPTGELGSEFRFHSLYISNAKIKDEYFYQFVKNGKVESIPVANYDLNSSVKIDPYSEMINYDDKGGYYNGYKNPRSVVFQDTNFDWQYDQENLNQTSQSWNNWIIYQLWPLTFNPKKINGKWTHGTFNDILERTEYLATLGVTAVELLPVNETRFGDAWGYALDSILLIEKTYGSRDDLKKLIDNLHAKKIRVLFDAVINHVNNTLIREPFSGSQNASKFYDGSTPWGPKPRFDSPIVRKWIMDSLVSVMRDFHLDGYRFDMTDSIFNGSKSGFLFLQEMNQIFKTLNPLFYSSAEQLPDNVWVTFPIDKNGMAFDSQWNDRFKNVFEVDFKSYSENSRFVDLTNLRSAMLGFSDHSMGYGNDYHFGAPSVTVNYLGSHDFVGNENPLIRIVSKYLAYEYEDNNRITRVRPLEDPNYQSAFKMIHNDFTHALTRTAYGVLFSKPGGLLFYQGEEFAQDLNIENEWSYVAAKDGNRFPSKNVDTNKYVGSHRMPWEYLIPELEPVKLAFLKDSDKELFKGHYRYFKDLIEFRKRNPDLNNHNAQNVQILNDKMISYELHADQSHYFVIANFGSRNDGAWISFPGNESFYWKEIFNSSIKKYGGTSNSYTNVIHNVGGRHNSIRLDGPSIIIFEKIASPGLTIPLYLRGSFNGWQATDSYALSNSQQNSDELIATIIVKQAGTQEFKIGSSDWQVEMGAASAVQSLATSTRKNYVLADNYVARGLLSYLPNQSNISVFLQAGKYNFRFNSRSFTYIFEQI